MKKKFLLIIILIFFFLAFRATDKPVYIYTIGDSTMANKKPEVHPETGWCQVLSSFFNSNVTIKNHAVNGHSTKSFIESGLWQAVLNNLKSSDFVFIQFAHNDQAVKDPRRFASPFGTYSKNLEKFVTETRAEGATAILFTPIVRRKFDNHGKLIDTHGDYLVAVRQVAEKLNVPLIDLQKLTENWVNSLGDEHSKKMFLWTEPNKKFPKGRKDNIHLSVEGAVEIARLATQEFKRQKLEIAEYLK